MTYVNAPIGAGQKVPGALKPHIACPTTSGTGSETTGHRDLQPDLDQRQDRHHLAPADPDHRADRSGRDRDAAEQCRRRHRLRLHEPRAGIDHGARVAAAARIPRAARAARYRRVPIRSPTCWPREALKGVGKFLVRAVSDATDTEARTEMMYAAMLAGIAFNAAGCHLPHGLSYAVSGLARDCHVPGYPEGKSLVPHGMAVVLNNPSVWRYTAPCCPERHLHGAPCLGAPNPRRATGRWARGRRSARWHA